MVRRLISIKDTKSARYLKEKNAREKGADVMAAAQLEIADLLKVEEEKAEAALVELFTIIGRKKTKRRRSRFYQ